MISSRRRPVIFGLAAASLLLLLQAVAASATLIAVTSNPAPMQVQTATAALAAVESAGDANPGVNLLSKTGGRRGFFFVKNFGTLTHTEFTLQQSLGAATLRYCSNQGFRPSPPSTTICADGSGAISLGAGASFQVVLARPIAPGEAYGFAYDAPNNTDNTISVLVRPTDR